MRSFRVLLISVLLPVALFAQSSDYSQKEKNKYWDTETLYLEGNFPEAIKGFEEMKSIDTSFDELFYFLGDSYFKMGDYNKAVPNLKKGSRFKADAFYYLAYIKLYHEELDSADFFIKKYKTNYKISETSIKKVEMNQLEGNIKNAAFFLDNGEIVNIINVGKNINTEADEYVPLISSDEELMILLPEEKIGDKPLDPFGEPYEDIYYSTNKEGSYLWTKADLIQGKVNTAEHDACVGLSPDGNKLFVFRTNDNKIGGDLYESLKIGNEWTTPIRLSNTINGYESIEPSATISLDEKTLYFSSNREGGYGGFDLYQAKLLPNGEWSLPRNLGAKVNTALDEDAPFIHPDGKTLYFSSKGHKNMGGYDIFKVEIDDKGISTPENLGYPTNSTKDDIYFTISANEKHGYYSSDKVGGFGGQDIYIIDYLEKSLRQSVISGTVLHDKIPTGAEVTILDIESGDLNGVYIANPKTGKFIFLVNPDKEYEIIVEGEGFEEYNEVISYSIDDLMKKQKKIIEIKKLPAEQ